MRIEYVHQRRPHGHQTHKLAARPRRYIQTAPKSAATLARELGVALTTIYKWKRAGRVHDGSHVRHQLHGTSPEQEALIAELRTQLRLSLDDVTEVLNRCSATPLSRSAIHRCLVRLGVARLPPTSPDAPPVGRFAATPCAIHSGSALQKQPSYVFVATAPPAMSGSRCCDAGHRRIPGRVSVHTILTDNDGAFTDRFAVHKKGKPAGQPTGTHRLDVPGARHHHRPAPIIHRRMGWSSGLTGG